MNRRIQSRRGFEAFAIAIVVPSDGIGLISILISQKIYYMLYLQKHTMRLAF